MNRLNRRGLNIDPWGTPCWIVFQSEWEWPTLTRCNLPHIWANKTCCTFNKATSFQLGYKYRLWEIESKALDNLVQTIFPDLWSKSYEFWLFHPTVCPCLIHWSNNFGIVSSAAIWTALYDAWRVFSLKGCRNGAVVRALASHQCGPGSIPRSSVICGLSLLVLYSALRGFLRELRFPLISKTSIWLHLCSSARTTRHLNKVPFLFLPISESAAIHLEACASSASSEGPGRYLTSSPWGEAEWAIDPWPLRAKGVIALVSPN